RAARCAGPQTSPVASLSDQESADATVAAPVHRCRTRRATARNDQDPGRWPAELDGASLFAAGEASAAAGPSPAGPASTGLSFGGPPSAGPSSAAAGSGGCWSGELLGFRSDSARRIAASPEPLGTLRLMYAAAPVGMGSQKFTSRQAS